MNKAMKVDISFLMTSPIYIVTNKYAVPPIDVRYAA